MKWIFSSIHLVDSSWPASSVGIEKVYSSSGLVNINCLFYRERVKAFSTFERLDCNKFSA